jgi:hypothetical protein
VDCATKRNTQGQASPGCRMRNWDLVWTLVLPVAAVFASCASRGTRVARERYSVSPFSEQHRPREEHSAGAGNTGVQPAGREGQRFFCSGPMDDACFRTEALCREFVALNCRDRRARGIPPTQECVDDGTAACRSAERAYCLVYELGPDGHRSEDCYGSHRRCTAHYSSTMTIGDSWYRLLHYCVMVRATPD